MMEPTENKNALGKSEGESLYSAQRGIQSERRTKSENDPVFLEMVANYVLIVVSQHQVRKQWEAEAEEEKSDPMLLFRERFFRLQVD